MYLGYFQVESVDGVYYFDTPTYGGFIYGWLILHSTYAGSGSQYSGDRIATFGDLHQIVVF